MLWLTYAYSGLHKPLFCLAKVHVDHQKLPLTYNNDMVVLLNKDVGSNYLILEFTLH